MEYLTGSGQLREDQIDGSYDGTPGQLRRRAGQGRAAGLRHRRAVRLPERASRPGASRSTTSSSPTRATRSTPWRSRCAPRTSRAQADCLKKLIPVVQQATVDYFADPTTANALVVEAVEKFNTGWVYDAGQAADGTTQQIDLGIVGQRPGRHARQLRGGAGAEDPRHRDADPHRRTAPPRPTGLTATDLVHQRVPATRASPSRPTRDPERPAPEQDAAISDPGTCGGRRADAGRVSDVSARCQRPPAGSSHDNRPGDRGRGPRQALSARRRRSHGVDIAVRSRHRARRARPQRRGQDDRGPHPRHADPSRRRHGARSTASTCSSDADAVRRRSASPASTRRSTRTCPARQNLVLIGRLLDLSHARRPCARQRAARRLRPHRGGGPAREDLLRWHAPPARPRGRASSDGPT